SRSRRRIKPGRGMFPRQHETEIEGGENLGEEFGAGIVAEERKARLVTLLVVDRTERAREICVFQGDLGGGKASRGCAHVLFAGQRVEAGIKADIGAEGKLARRI